MGYKEHPDWNQLAALVDRGVDAVDPDVTAHLASCPECFAAWSAAVQERDAQLAGASVAVAPSGKGRSRRSWYAVGSLAAILALAILIPRFTAAPGPAGLVQDQLASLSREGMIYPRVEVLEVAVPTQYRSEGGAESVDTTPWSARLADDPTDNDAVYWLAASYLAGGRPTLADDLLRQTMTTNPREADLRELAAVAAYRINDLARAEELLADLLAERPERERARFNLALVRLETGRVEEARPELEALAAGAEVPAVRQRALGLFKDLGAR